MDPEIKSFIKVWSITIVGLIYCYFISSRVSKGVLRLLSLAPIIYLITTLPLELHSFQLGWPTVCILVWLTNFKLLLFAFDQPPLSLLSGNLFRFVAIACLPINITPKHEIHPPKNLDEKSFFPNSKPDPSETKGSRSGPAGGVTWKMPTSVKVLILVGIFVGFEYRARMNSFVILVLMCWYSYLVLDLILAASARLARPILGFELQPNFDEPYLTTSLQDFWGRRWNMTVVAILRPTCYEPVRHLAAPLLGPKLAQTVGSIWAFTVSGLMHEAIYFYQLRSWPTWEVTSFFVLQGVCVAAEVAAKRRFRDKWQPSGLVSGGLAIGFLLVTAHSIMFPPLVRNGIVDKAVLEFDIMMSFLLNNQLLHKVINK